MRICELPNLLALSNLRVFHPAVTRLLSGFLYGVSALDPVVFATVSLALLATGLLAGYLPARWAARADPVAVLRVE